MQYCEEKQLTVGKIRAVQKLEYEFFIRLSSPLDAYGCPYNSARYRVYSLKTVRNIKLQFAFKLIRNFNGTKSVFTLKLSGES